MRTARIIYNPTAGREVFKQKLPEVLIKLEDSGYITSVHATKSEGDAAYASARACEMNFDLVIAVGGDGTISEVINGMAEIDNRPTLGIVPVGTVNDYGSALKLPEDVMEAVNIICNGKTVNIDIGKVNEKYFMNIAGGGQITSVSYEAPSKLKSVIGPLAYYVKGIEMIPQLTSSNVKIEYDDEVFEGDVMLFLVGLTNSIGGFEKLVPDAKFNDGYFSLLYLEACTLTELAHIMTLATRGEHLKHSKVHSIKAKSIRITSKEDVKLNLDGEYGGLLPVEFVNLKEHISVKVPNTFDEK